MSSTAGRAEPAVLYALCLITYRLCCPARQCRAGQHKHKCGGGRAPFWVSPPNPHQRISNPANLVLIKQAARVTSRRRCDNIRRCLVGDKLWYTSSRYRARHPRRGRRVKPENCLFVVCNKGMNKLHTFLDWCGKRHWLK